MANELKVHFLNVGRGDCTIIEFPSGRIAIVDIDNLKVLDPETRNELLAEYHESVDYLIGSALGFKSSQQLDDEFLKAESEKTTDPLAYYDTHIGSNQPIFRFIITHPDMDHMTGLHRIHEQEASKNIVNFWHTGMNDFNLANATDTDCKKGGYDLRDWQTYKNLRAGNGTTALQLYQGSTGNFWTEDGVELWAPTSHLEKVAVEKGQSNILSMVLRITYAGRSIVLGGDATGDESWPEICSTIANMGSISVLKASHHGRKSGYYGPAVKAMSPWLTITSVGEKEHDATEHYRQYSNYTVSLRKCGDVTITVAADGKWYYSPNVADHWKPKKEPLRALARSV